jgi:CubicO group peptidase (beta-lactamase class C family)
MKYWLFIIAFSVCIYSHSYAQKNIITALSELKQFEGKFEYSNPDTIVFAASDFDTILYAIIDDAKYPMTHFNKDTFADPSKTPFVFLRDENGKVKSYQTLTSSFKVLAPLTETYEWFPRKQLFRIPDDYVYHIPEKKDDGIQTGDLKKAFTHPELVIEMVKETIRGNYPDVHSILIYKNGQLVLEEYFYDYDQDKPHQLRSASKSFIGTLVGIAIDQGKIKNEYQKLLPLFKSKYPSVANLDARKQMITIQDFLTYRHGMDCNDENPATKGHELKMMESDDWVKFTLDLPMTDTPGIKSSYCTACAQTLGKLVELKTKTPLEEYAKKNLFSPMGITNYKWRFKTDRSSISTFNQMYLRPRDMLKLAKLYQDKGKWKGKQIVSSEWIKKTFAKDDPEFGYLWRHKYFDVDGKRYNSYLATGNGGQKINIWPELNMITVFTGGNYNAYLYGRETPPNEMIPKYILKAL